MAEESKESAKGALIEKLTFAVLFGPGVAAEIVKKIIGL